MGYLITNIKNLLIMSIWDDLRDKGKDLASEALSSAIPVITEKLGEVLKGTLEKKEGEKTKS